MGTILVTGASRGIGRGIALELAAAGHRVAIHYNGNRDAALRTADECRTRSERLEARAAAARAATGAAVAGSDASDAPAAEIFQANIAVAADRERLVREVLETFGDFDGLVNNAGIAPRRRDDIVYAEEEVFDEVMKVNLYGPYFLTQLVARHWLEHPRAGGAPSTPGDEVSAGGAPSTPGDEVSAGGAPSTPGDDAPRSGSTPTPGDEVPPAPRGRIVFVSSVSAVMVSTQRGEYCVSKAGLGMAAELFAVRLAGEGIYTFEIRPGIIATDMTSGVKEKYDGLIADGLVPQRRWGTPHDNGAAVRAIMEGAMDFAPGTVIYTDGGLHIPRL